MATWIFLGNEYQFNKIKGLRTSKYVSHQDDVTYVKCLDTCNNVELLRQAGYKRISTLKCITKNGVKYVVDTGNVYGI